MSTYIAPLNNKLTNHHHHHHHWTIISITHRRQMEADLALHLIEGRDGDAKEVLGQDALLGAGLEGYNPSSVRCSRLLPRHRHARSSLGPSCKRRGQVGRPSGRAFIAGQIRLKSCDCYASSGCREEARGGLANSVVQDKASGREAQSDSC